MTLFSTPSITCKLIDPTEDNWIKEASVLEKDVWGKLGQSPEHFRERAKNGFLIGAFSNRMLVGTISCVRRRWDPFDQKAVSKGHPYATWDGITSFGTFKENEPDGDALFCVAITAKGAGKRSLAEIPEGDSVFLRLGSALRKGEETEEIAEILCNATADLYIPTDYVMRFHARPKICGIGGAKIVQILPKGRPEDFDAMGYNCVMAYPQINSMPLDYTSDDVSVGEALIVSAARLSMFLNIKVVSPYSRPAGFRDGLIKGLLDAHRGHKGSLTSKIIEVVRTLYGHI